MKRSIATVSLSGTLPEKLDAIAAAGFDGVEIFFTQVFRDSFFHADMHPGNIFVSTVSPWSPQYIAIIHDAGNTIFANLALIFAIGIAVGFARG